MKLLLNSVYLQRKRKLILSPQNHTLPIPYLATALKNLETYRFTLSIECIEILKTYSVKDFMLFYTHLLKQVKQLVGAHVKYRPMYPNFPQQVMSMSEAELYLRAIIHYATGIVYSFPEKERDPHQEKIKLKQIGLGSEEELLSIFRKVITANSSISFEDKEDLSLIISEIDDITKILPTEIPFKENMACTIAFCIQHNKVPPPGLHSYVQTVTDVLRIATAMSNGDTSLAENTQYRKFKRHERRMLLSLLEHCATENLDDWVKYKENWLRLGEILHPGEYKKRFPKTYQAFYTLRNQRKIETFNSRVEDAIQNKNHNLAVELLKKSPGELVRRMDHLLRTTSCINHILEPFEQVVHLVSTRVLLQLMTYYQHRNYQTDLRTFFPKGNVSKVYAIPNQLPVLPDSVCHQVIEIIQHCLTKRFSTLTHLGNIYVDEQLKRFPVPFSQRSASKALRTVSRGSKLPIPNGDTLRFFTWWKEGIVNGKDTGNVDIDLSVVLYNPKWEYLDHISYTHLKSEQYHAYHSGDIVTAPNGACEFIDINLRKLRNNGSRYAIFMISSFSMQPYCDLPECFAGWMIRQNPNSGEIFEPTTVQDRLDISSDTEICIPLIVDVEKREVIWTDLALTRNPFYFNNVEGNTASLVLMGKAMTTLQKTTLYDLFMLHAKARGNLVSSPSEADTIFSVETGITPFEIETITSEYMI